MCLVDQLFGRLPSLDGQSVKEKGPKRLQCDGSGDDNENAPDSPQMSGPASRKQRIWDFATTEGSKATFLRHENSKLRKPTEEYKQETHAAKVPLVTYGMITVRLKGWQWRTVRLRS